ncbi:hypothetical protein [Actinomadura bangladeshensis]|uniref:hypothetical protein n=1 Tax=Actinomadura bangladeshensis TaxID=453573 RepID=UPI0031DC2A93
MEDLLAWAIALSAVVAAAAAGYWFYAARPVRTGAPEQARRAELALREDRRAAARAAASLGRLTERRAGEARFELLKQKHRESVAIADKWYAHKHDALRTRRRVAAGLARISRRERRLAGEPGAEAGRGGAAPARRRGARAEARRLRRLIDDMDAVLRSLDEEIRLGAANLRDHNARTRRLKEHIRDDCGAEGRLWYARLEARTRRRLASGTPKPSRRGGR